jgi:hypothetical protein
MKIDRKAGILEIGNLDSLSEEPGVILRTVLGEEITIPLLKNEAMEIGKAGLLYANLKVTITLEAEDETT